MILSSPQSCIRLGDIQCENVSALQDYLIILNIYNNKKMGKLDAILKNSNLLKLWKTYVCSFPKAVMYLEIQFWIILLQNWLNLYRVPNRYGSVRDRLNVLWFTLVPKEFWWPSSLHKFENLVQLLLIYFVLVNRALTDFLSLYPW